MKTAVSYILAVSLFALVSSCATTSGRRSAADYLQEIQILQQRLIQNPNDAATLRELGVAYFQIKDFDPAKQHLYRAFVLVPLDARSMFYYGMTLEFLGHIESALAVYVNFTEISTQSPYRKLIEGRYQALVREVIRKQLLSTIANEKQLGASQVSPKAIAVFPLHYQGNDERFVALSKGLSELILVDLGQVKGIQLIERIRTEELLNELKFSQSAFVDRASAPRLGKLLSAGRVVAGSFNVQKTVFRMDVAAWDIVQRKFPDFTSKADDLDNLFKVQKEMVFSLIRELGIALTQEEREKIQLIPTKNFLAFMNYCMGLRSEDALDFTAAIVYYKQAVSLDPGFVIAQKKVSAMEAINTAGGPKEHALSLAQRLDRPLIELSSERRRRLVDIRLGHLTEGMGNTFLPGNDNRDPVEEAVRGGAVGKLPEPPHPPRPPGE
ncbi:MAG: hypothetical protein HY961_14465 [Ignavibacteriae bacterium]|nr:hypothetical protein [Ignavibacteriota bacterium]